MFCYVGQSIQTTSAMPDSFQIIAIAALSFGIGVLVCLFCGLYLLPALMRAQSADLIRDYSTYAQAAAPMRVIVLDRNGGQVAQPSQPAAAAHPVSRSTRVDSASSLPRPSVRTQPLAQPTNVFDEIYEHNLQLRGK